MREVGFLKNNREVRLSLSPSPLEKRKINSLWERRRQSGSMGVVLALGAAGIGFVFGLLLLCVLGEKAWHQAIALSVGVFLVVLVGLVAQSSQLLLVGTVLVTSCSLLWWYVGLWTSIVVIIGVLGCSHAFLVVWPPQSSSSH